MNPHRRHLLLGACCAPLATLFACSRPDDASSAPVPVEIEAGTACDLDGMLLADYPGPKGQIHYAGAAAPVFCCDTVELFALLLRPEQARPVRVALVQDMAQADWNQPRGHWFDARQGFYVLGSKRHGSMGPTLASFAAQEPAAAFAREFGGRVLRFAEITPDQADLRGGAQRDQRM
jgi:copper chaperone NosL